MRSIVIASLRMCAIVTSALLLWIPARADVWAWGANNYGQLGNGLNTYNDNPNYDAIRVEGLENAIAVSAGTSHSLALTSDGSVWAWGSNIFEQLGIKNGPPPVPLHYAPAQVSGIAGVIAVAAGSTYSVALRNDGTVWGWGFNGSGQLGTTSESTFFKPVPIAGLSNIVAIAAGGYHLLALKNDGTVWACGRNRDGQLGSSTNFGTDSANPVPSQIPGLTSVAAIAAGGLFSMALGTDGAVWTWGANYDGQLGNGTSAAAFAPTRIAGLPGIVSISAGNNFALALGSDGTVWSWGNNSYGQLGYQRYPSNSPSRVDGVAGVTTISAGSGHSLVLQTDGTAWAWGENFYGELGTRRAGTTDSNPAAVPSLNGVTYISAGAEFNLALSNVSQQLTIGAGGIVDAASYRPALSPGAIATVFGNNLASGSLSAATFPLPLELLDTTINVAGVLAPLFFVSQTQINFQVPFEAPVGPVDITVARTDGTTASRRIELQATSPAIFPMDSKNTGPLGLGAILHANDYWPVNASAPAEPGEFVLIYCTGLGFVSGAQSGQASPSNEVSPRPSVSIDSTPATVAYAGLAPGMVGLYQINAQIPPGLLPRSSDVYASMIPVQIAAGSATSNIPNLPFANTNRVPVLATYARSRLTNGSMLIVLAGSGFSHSSVVRMDDTDQPTAFIRRDQVSITIPEENVIPGAHKLRIFNPPPGGGLSGELSVTTVYNLGGTWRGNWQSPGGSGSLFLNLSETDFGVYTGTLSINGSPVISQCSASATNDVSTIALNATCTGYLNLAYTITYRGTIGGPNSLQGTWTLTASGTTMDSGVFTAAR